MSSHVRPRPARVRRPVLGAVGLLGFLRRLAADPARWAWSTGSTCPTPPTSGARLAQEVADLAFWRRLGLTMQAWAIGLTIASVAALVLGTVIGLVPFLRRATHTTVEFLRPIPSVALVPLAVSSRASASRPR